MMGLPTHLTLVPAAAILGVTTGAPAIKRYRGEATSVQDVREELTHAMLKSMKDTTIPFVPGFFTPLDKKPHESLMHITHAVVGSFDHVSAGAALMKVLAEVDHPLVDDLRKASAAAHAQMWADEIAEYRGLL